MHTTSQIRLHVVETLHRLSKFFPTIRLMQRCRSCCHPRSALAMVNYSLADNLSLSPPVTVGLSLLACCLSWYLGALVACKRASWAAEADADLDACLCLPYVAFASAGYHRTGTCTAVILFFGAAEAIRHAETNGTANFIPCLHILTSLCTPSSTAEDDFCSSICG